MCNLYRLDAPASQIGTLFDAEADADPWDGGYVAPLRPGPVITSNGRTGSRRFVRPMLWGFPPPPKATGPVTNVRNLSSPFWIGTLRHSELRCLVPVTSFQLWSGAKGTKTQHWFSLPSRPIFAIAAIFRHTEDWPTFALLTTEPNRLVEQYHPKTMPVILHPDDYGRWLSADWKEAQQLVAPYPSQLMAVGDRPPNG